MINELALCVYRVHGPAPPLVHRVTGDDCKLDVGPVEPFGMLGVGDSRERLGDECLLPERADESDIDRQHSLEKAR